jgi:toxin YoeB
MQPRSGLVMWKVYYTKQAQKDARKLASSGLKNKVEELIKLISENPYQNPPPYEKLVGDLSGALSRRINIQHRLVYQVYEREKSVKVLCLWTHYE